MSEATEEQSAWGLLTQGMGRVFVEAVVVAVVCGLVAVAVNAWLHPESIPFLADEEYDTMVPCPEPGGEVIAMGADDPALGQASSFVVDARDEQAYQGWHFAQALNLTYDYLDPTPEAAIESLAKAIARSRAQKVIVYGDGDDPDTGEQLGKEISGKGIKNVHFVKGGAPALKAARSGGSQAGEGARP